MGESTCMLPKIINSRFIQSEFAWFSLSLIDCKSTVLPVLQDEYWTRYLPLSNNKYYKKNSHQSQSFFEDWPQNWYCLWRFVNKLGTMHKPSMSPHALAAMRSPMKCWLVLILMLMYKTVWPLKLYRRWNSRAKAKKSRFTKSLLLLRIP